MNTDDFYASIVNTTKLAAGNHILSGDSDSVFNLLTGNWQNYVSIAASSGHSKAYLCIYKSTAKYLGIIPIDKYIRPSAEFEQKLRENNLENIMDRVQESLKPFTVGAEALSPSVIAVVVSWDVT